MPKKATNNFKCKCKELSPPEVKKSNNNWILFVFGRNQNDTNAKSDIIQGAVELFLHE